MLDILERNWGLEIVGFGRPFHITKKNKSEILFVTWTTMQSLKWILVIKSGDSIMALTDGLQKKK